VERGSAHRALVAVAVGAGAMVVGSFLEWATYSHANPPTPTGITLPLRSLYRPAIVRATGSPESSPGALLLVLVVIALLGVWMRRGLIIVLAGAGGASVVALVLVQIAIDDLSSRPAFPLGVGIFVAGIGSLVAVAGGAMLMLAARRRAYG